MKDAKDDLRRSAAVHGRTPRWRVGRSDGVATLEGKLGHGAVDKDGHRLVRSPGELVSERLGRAKERFLVGAAVQHKQ